jgi:amino acid adenylation domain-containing protein
MTLRRELEVLYDDLRALLPPIGMRFRDYAVAMTDGLAKTNAYRNDVEHWTSRLDSLALPPSIPLKPTLDSSLNQENKSVKGPAFMHLAGFVDRDQWGHFKRMCASHNMTPTAALASIYAQALGAWTTRDGKRDKRLLINVMHTTRLPLHRDVGNVFGNFSSTTLLDAVVDPSCAFRSNAAAVADQLAADLEHWRFGGVDVSRVLNTKRGSTLTAVAPFVFTSTLGLLKASLNPRGLCSHQSFTCVTTPHVSIDHQVVEERGSLAFYFDVAVDVFPPEVVNGLVATYQTLLDSLCGSKDNWVKPVRELLPEAPSVQPYRPDCVVPKRLLHEGMIENGVENGGALAVVNESTRLSYAELETSSRQVSECILERLNNKLPSELVVVVLMEKGWRQVVASLGCLRASGAYLPMDPKLPEQRQQHIVQASGASLVIADKSGIEKAPWLLDRSDLLVEVDKVLANNVSSLSAAELNEKVANLLAPRTFTDQALAYLIYTSGSTGLPKGVRCHHGGAMNTILDLNSEFNVGPSDRVLGLSSLSFDLSVYDIFGMLEAGAALVIPPADAVSPPDPQQWLDLLHSEKVTIWNTVPRFMELMVSHVEQSNEKIPESLRVIFMSGDFIPLTLCKRIREACACSELRIVSMGGATEAAVWSNIHEVSAELDPTWSSIPYGRAMRNQRMYILDENLDHCAPWVTGVIYIGGLGVALGYQGDAERTAYQFIKHPRSGEYLFRTGDLGRVRPGSTSSSSSLLEILGREDSQVKVGGFRVELGEIERVAETHDGVLAAVAAVQGSFLVLFVSMKESVGSYGSVEEEASNNTLDSEIKKICSEQLPPYMVPKAVSTVDRFPLNSNGKIDRGKLPLVDFGSTMGGNVVDDTNTPDCTMVGDAPMNGEEFEVRALFAEILRMPPSSLSTTASFFALGGDSLTALLLLRKLREQFSMKISVADLFSNSSIREICKLRGVNELGGDINVRTSQLQLLTLKEPPKSSSSGDADDGVFGLSNSIKVPLVLIHAAGASGLSYRPLVDAMDPLQPVYAIDDASLGGDVAFTLPSITAVAEAIIALLKSSGLLMNHASIQLGGWSYGGVVALEVALLLQSKTTPQQFDRKDSSGSEVVEFASVDSVVLFDSPVRVEGDAVSSEYNNIEQTMRDLQGPGANESLIKAAANHFDNCTRLLNNHYSLSPTKPNLACPIISFRPIGSSSSTSSVIDPDLRLHSLTSSYWHTLFVDGNHWTMLFPPNTIVLARNVQNIIDLASSSMRRLNRGTLHQSGALQTQNTKQSTKGKTKHRATSLDASFMETFASTSTSSGYPSSLMQLSEDIALRNSHEQALLEDSQMTGSSYSSRYRTSST